MSAYIYMVRCNDDSLYSGYTTDIEKRLQTHNSGNGAKYTRSRLPVTLAYCQQLPDISSAMRQEVFLKQLPRKKKQLICENWAAEQLRFATEQDADQILEIYRYYVENSTATFAYTAPTSEEYRRWVQNSAKEYPFLVLEREGKILGFACAHRWRDREAFDWSVETTIYLAPDQTQGGRGLRLYGTLLALLHKQGVYHAYAVLAHPNPASEALHAKLGFLRLGYLPACGFKHGGWHGNTIWDFTLHQAKGKPEPILPFWKLLEQNPDNFKL